MKKLNRPKVAYFHGLESSQGGNKVKYMRLEHEVYAPTMDYTDPKLFQATLNEVIKFKPDLLIGSSMGGYFAYLLSTHTGIPVLLFNPALHSRSFQPEGVQLGDTKVTGVVVLGKKDKIIPYRETMAFLQGSIDEGSIEIHKENYGHRTPFSRFVSYL